MFPSSRRPTSPTLAASAFRTARLLKALATLDMRPLDADGRPVDLAAGGDRHEAPRRLTRTPRARRPGAVRRPEHCCSSPHGGGDSGDTPAVLA
ncbi:MAG: hypothetical protein V9E83_05940 [Baekduia sp.]